VNCCPCTFSLTSSPPPLPMYSICRNVTVGGGGGVLKCIVDHILKEFNTMFLTRFRTYKIATPPQTKMTSKDDIKGFVSLKFLRLWCAHTCSTPVPHCSHQHIYNTSPPIPPNRSESIRENSEKYISYVELLLPIFRGR
jgi:hypothetical protein